MSALAGWWVGWLPTVIFFGLTIWLLVRGNRRYREGLAAWRPLRATWTTLLYCARCDMVWHPDRRMPVRPEQRQQLWA